VLLRAQKLAPRNEDLLYQFTTIANNAGHVLEARGRVDEATASYRRMLAMAQELAKIDAGKVDWQNQLGTRPQQPGEDGAAAGRPGRGHRRLPRRPRHRGGAGRQGPAQ
jgi:hypothetical protein